MPVIRWQHVKKPNTSFSVTCTGVLAVLAALCLAACNSSPDITASGGTKTYGDPQATVVPLLTGEAASNEVRFLEYIRHWPKKAAFERRTYSDPKNPSNQLKYFLFKPKGFQREQTYPLVLSLHGGAPRHHFEDLLEPYLPGLAYGLGRLICDETQDKHPCFVIAPWSNERNWDEENIRLTMALLASLQKEFHIDTNRIYVTGQSMGGWGTWSIITEQPGTFAAAIPICGGGEPTRASRAKDIPIWAFHGTADQVVPVAYTRIMIAALKKAGGKPIYWEYKDADHSGTAERAYCEPELIEWLFAQRKP
jgi:predicted peptidase